MGLEYQLICKDCDERSELVEFSVCSDYRVKNLPDDYETLERDWVAFLVKHSGHRIALVDIKENETDPAKITGGYVIGLESLGSKNS